MKRPKWLRSMSHAEMERWKARRLRAWRRRKRIRRRRGKHRVRHEPVLAVGRGSAFAPSRLRAVARVVAFVVTALALAVARVVAFVLIALALAVAVST